MCNSELPNFGCGDAEIFAVVPEDAEESQTFRQVPALFYNGYYYKPHTDADFCLL